MCAFGLAHALAVVACFPATILFELAAGYAFGPWGGAALAWAAKVVAASFTYLVSSQVARAALGRAGVQQAAERAYAAQPELARLVKAARLEPERAYAASLSSPG